MIALDGEEMWYADFNKREGVYPLPPFIDPFRYPDGEYDRAEANQQICKENLKISRIGMKEIPLENDPPSTPIIYSRDKVELGVQNTMICHVTGFYPAPVKVYWTKNGKNVTEGTSINVPFPNKDGSFRQSSRLEFIPQLGDMYSCSVAHPTLSQPLTRIWDVEVLMFLSPDVDVLMFLSPDVEVLMFLSPDVEVLMFLSPDVELLMSLSPDVEVIMFLSPDVELLMFLSPDVEVLMFLSPDVEVLMCLSPDVEVLMFLSPDVEVLMSLSPDVEVLMFLSPDVELLMFLSPDVEVLMFLSPDVEVLMFLSPDVDVLMFLSPDVEVLMLLCVFCLQMWMC
ncbi:MHC class II antigen alpha chain [Scomber scombrus]|uniref:MHC class II antigen alpha chain n=1 Tax=Scomber scombrus TaxID=13677 RepID=A0AAV1QKM9_SCOSC